MSIRPSIAERIPHASSPAPRISVAIPVYNGENYLAQTIDSILAQTFPDFELILCDNASTDRTADICQEYAGRDERVCHYRSETNIGWAQNHNRALGLARGEWFKWAAHDDLLAPDFLKDCGDLLEAEPDVVLCYPRTKFIDEQGNFLGCYEDNLDLRQPRASQRFRAYFTHQSLSHPVFGLMRTAVARRTTGMGSYLMSDRVLIGQMALNGQIAELPEYLFLRRLHNSISTNINTSSSQMLRWINPKMRGKIHFPRWRRLVEYTRAINRTRMDPAERMRCYLVLAGFMFVPQRWAGLVEDLARAVGKPHKQDWMH